MEPTIAAGGDRACTPGSPDQPTAPFENLLRECSSSAIDRRMAGEFVRHAIGIRGSGPGWRVIGQEFERRLPRPWLDLVREVTGRGVQVRRARVISEPADPLCCI